MSVASFWHNLIHRRRAESELDAEMRAVYELLVDQKIAEGVAPAKARRAARLDIGGIEQVKEQVREVRAGEWCRSILLDTRFALRTSLRNPGFTLLVIVTLGLGIGATTAVFGVVDGILLKPLPVKDQRELLVAWTSIPGFEHWPFSYAAFDGMRERLRTASGIGAHPYASPMPVVVDTNREARLLQVTAVTGNWFDVLGVRPIAGRLFGTQDDHIGAVPVLVLSSGVARRLFGSISNALNRTLAVDGSTYTVVGVAPADFEYPHSTEAWTAATPFITRREHVTSLFDANRVRWEAVARVAPGYTPAQTRAELASALATLPRESTTLSPQMIRTASFADVVLGDVRRGLLMLAAAVLFVLIVSCANVANLLLVRGIARRHELATRVAIGANRSRIIRQLATETLLLAACGTAMAIFVADATLRLLLALAPTDLPRLSQIQINGRVLTFSAGIAMLVAMIVGIVPAFQRAALLRMPDGRLGLGNDRYWLRHGLVIAQIALTVVMMSAAGLLLSSLDRLRQIDIGFDPKDVELVDVALPPSQYPEPFDQQRMLMQLAKRVAVIPGVAGATALYEHPFAGSEGADISVFADDQSFDKTTKPFVNYEGVDSAYFATLDLPILQGRGIEDRDRAGTESVVVVNEAFARLFWPGSDPVGRRIRWAFEGSKGDGRRVVGLAADTRYRELTTTRPTVYVPYEQGIPISPRYIAVRTNGPIDVAGAIRRAVSNEDPGSKVIGITPLPRLLAAPLVRPRFQFTLIASFAILGLLLSVVGTYGVLAFFVGQRTPEIGIRMALGAKPSSVFRLIIHQGLLVGVIGVSVGIAAAAAAGSFLQPLLFGVTAHDPLVLSAAAIAIFAITIVAAVPPARVAMRTDPWLVIRNE
jgi:putative ABC transport system permease protein